MVIGFDVQRAAAMPEKGEGEIHLEKGLDPLKKKINFTRRDF